MSGWKTQKQSKGFTIVELLIVVVVIAILAAITIVSYNGIQNRAHESSVQADLTSFSKKVESYKVEDPAGLYPSMTAATAQNLGIKVSTQAYLTGNNLIYCRADDGSAYALVARSKSPKSFYVSSQSGGVKEYTFTWATAMANVCPNVLSGGYSGNWGLQSGWAASL